MTNFCRLNNSVSAGLLLMFSNKDLIIVFTEDEPSVIIPDLLGMWDWGRSVS